MQWSQLKKRIESLFANSVKGRAELRTTRYHKAHDQMGRAWITSDGQEVINICTFAYESELWRESSRIREGSGCTDYRIAENREGYRAAYTEAELILREKAIFNRHAFHASLFSYLNLSIEQILSSPNPMIRAIGMLDRRVGKRRLSAMDMGNENPLVARLHQFRVEAEQIVNARRQEGPNRSPDESAS